MADDVTKQVDFGNNDDEALPLTKCVCGAVFETWTQVVSIYEDHPWVCPSCGAKLFFKFGIIVYKI